LRVIRWVLSPGKNIRIIDPARQDCVSRALEFRGDPFPDRLWCSCGYGIYQDTSMYQATALSMAQQPRRCRPRKLECVEQSDVPVDAGEWIYSVHGHDADTFALIRIFTLICAGVAAANSTGPASRAVMIATYSGPGYAWRAGILPTAMQWVDERMPSCPVGFVYKTSNGSSTREAGQVQVCGEIAQRVYCIGAVYVSNLSMMICAR